MTFILLVAATVVIVIGVNTLIWGMVAITRVVGPSPVRVAATRFSTRDVAIIMAAHNEENVLAESLQAAMRLLPPDQIHVISDGSKDRTVAIARGLGVHVLDLQPNRGKAGALAAGIEEFALKENYGVILLHDADTRLSDNYFDTGLPLFNDDGVVAVSGVVRTLMDPPPRTWTGKFLLAYRARLYLLTQHIVKFGQAASWVNVMPICPGFASMYRSDALAQVDITRPGLVIEDIHMTFDVHTKKLGRIAFHPCAAVAYTQDPDTWKDYISQIRRWSLGYWQTVRIHYRHLGKFWISVAMQITELIVSSIVLALMVPLVLFWAYTQTLAHTYGLPVIAGQEVTGTLAPYYVLIGFFMPDMVFTVFVAIGMRRPSMLLLAPFFPLMRFVDSYVYLRSIPTAFRARSTGKWVSPTRRNALTLVPH